MLGMVEKLYGAETQTCLQSSIQWFIRKAAALSWDNFQ